MGDARGVRVQRRRSFALAPVLVLALAAALALAVGACRDASGPSSTPFRLEPNVSVMGIVREGDTARYYVDVVAGVPFTVALTALRNFGTLIIRDSTGREQVPRVHAVVIASTSMTVTSFPIERDFATRYDVLVIGEGRFALRLYEATPEHVAAELVPGTTVDESIDVPNDIDSYTVRGAPGDRFIFYLRALDPSGGKSLMARIVAPARYGEDLQVVSYGNDPEIETQFSRTFKILDDAPVTIRVSGDYVGRYQLLVRRIETRPEVAAEAALENDTTLTERIDYVGDIDEFRISGTPGARYRLFFRLANGRPSQMAFAYLIPDEASDAEYVTRSSGSDTSWRDRSTQTLTLGASGRATVAVIPDGVARGAYELYLYRIDPRPEHAPRALSRSDSVTAETVELPGDVDEYDIDLVAGDTLSVTFNAPLPPTVAALELSLIAPDGTFLARDSVLDNVPILMRLPAATSGRYRARVDNIFAAGRGYVGAYTLATHRFSGAPETGDGRLDWDEEVVEALEPLGDEDHYDLDITPGEPFELFLATLDLGAGLWLFGELGTFPSDFGYGFVMPGDRQYEGSRRLLQRRPGRYRVAVRPGPQGDVLTRRGRYRLTLRHFPTTPERVNAVVAPGDVVTDEGIDYLGDVDRFTVRAPPGSYLTAAITFGSQDGPIGMELLDPLTRDVVTSTASWRSNEAIGRWRVPPSGTLLLQLLEQGDFPQYRAIGPYKLEIFPLDARPEHTPAVVAIGDTVTTESLETGMDVDEFTVHATRGTTLAVYFDTPDGLSPQGLFIEAIDPRTGEVLGEVSCWRPSRFFGQSRTLDFTIPTTGPYIIRVRKLEWWFPEANRYKFAVVRP